MNVYAGWVLDHKTKHDPESKNYPVRSVLQPVPLKTKLWTPGQQLDQGQEGACVPHGIVAEALASPTRVGIPNAQAVAFEGYDWTRKNDEYPGENYEGTSVNAGMKWGRIKGWWDSYRWAFSMDDVIGSLIQLGPVVIGINWYSGMYEAPRGLVRVTGELVGGHCILLTGYSPNYNRKGPHVRWRNSWGSGYGVNGSAWISVKELTRLLIDEQGEAAIPMGRRLA